MFKSLWNFIEFWYLRYLLVTELYMVEKWERIMIHVVFAVIFSLISVFNVSIVLEGVKYINGFFIDSN